MDKENLTTRGVKLIKEFRSKFVGDNWRYGLSWSQARGEEDNGIESWLSSKFHELLSEIEDLRK